MEYFPIFMRLAGEPCLLVGGGEVAVRKARLLQSAGARLTVVAPQLVPAEFADMGVQNRGEKDKSIFTTGDRTRQSDHARQHARRLHDGHA